MKAKLIVEGKEFPIEIQDPELEKLLKPKKKTGYERADVDCEYYCEHCEGGVYPIMERNGESDDDSYECANYYSDETVAKNNARADKLMRQLRRFAAEHREDLDWLDEHSVKYYIYYDNRVLTLCIDVNCTRQMHGVIYFDTEKTAKLAIKTFHDELIWYFTEYKDSL